MGEGGGDGGGADVRAGGYGRKFCTLVRVTGQYFDIAFKEVKEVSEVVLVHCIWNGLAEGNPEGVEPDVEERGRDSIIFSAQRFRSLGIFFCPVSWLVDSLAFPNYTEGFNLPPTRSLAIDARNFDGLVGLVVCDDLSEFGSGKNLFNVAKHSEIALLADLESAVRSSCWDREHDRVGNRYRRDGCGTLKKRSDGNARSH